jgi:3-isopropylmalate/(R)-2-methylmalate dehydratase large subunit
MGSTISEKILASHAGQNKVEPGEIVEAEVDYIMVNDVTGLPAFRVYDENFSDVPIKKEKTILIPDHYVPNKDIKSAEQAKSMREFARKHDVPNYFEVGRGGVCHQIMIENGFAAPEG